MKIVTTPRAETYIAERGGNVWVWLDPHRGMIGSFVWLEAHTEPPRTSRRTSFSRSSRRPHRFRTSDGPGFELHHDWGRLDAPDELHLDVKGWRKGTRRLEAYWNGCVFAGPDVPAP
jgi:hypothetical protein